MNNKSRVKHKEQIKQVIENLKKKYYMDTFQIL